MAEEEGEDQEEQKRLRKQLAGAIRRSQIEQQKREMAKQLLDANAYERLTNIKAANYELYLQLLDLIISLAQSNRIQGKLTEAQFVAILNKVTYRREPTIEFKHK
jgi:DNA-binding TFAR19-related protein (PDSD5 family)